MKTNAQHIHRNKSVCWYDSSLKQWFTQDEKTTLNEPCSDPHEKGMIEYGDRTAALIAGDAPFTSKDQTGPA